MAKKTRAAGGTTRQPASAAKPAKRRAKQATPMLTAQQAMKRIIEAAGNVRDTILKGRKPTMRMPIRSLSNVRYHPRAGYFQLTMLALLWHSGVETR